jgi:hypothetical protein
MGKMSLKDVRKGYWKTLRNASSGRPCVSDIVFQIVAPLLVFAVVFSVDWPLTVSDLGKVTSDVVTGVSIVSSLMCGVATMIFQLRVQISQSTSTANVDEGPSEGDKALSKNEIVLVDEMFHDVLWSVVVGFAAVIVIVLGDIIGPSSAFLGKLALSLALGLVIHLAMVTCMSIKRMNAAYEIVAKVWGARRR